MSTKTEPTVVYFDPAILDAQAQDVDAPRLRMSLRRIALKLRYGKEVVIRPHNPAAN